MEGPAEGCSHQPRQRVKRTPEPQCLDMDWPPVHGSDRSEPPPADVTLGPYPHTMVVCGTAPSWQYRPRVKSGNAGAPLDPGDGASTCWMDASDQRCRQCFQVAVLSARTLPPHRRLMSTSIADSSMLAKRARSCAVGVKGGRPKVLDLQARRHERQQRLTGDQALPLRLEDHGGCAVTVQDCADDSAVQGPQTVIVFGPRGEIGDRFRPSLETAQPQAFRVGRTAAEVRHVGEVPLRNTQPRSVLTHAG